MIASNDVRLGDAFLALSNDKRRGMIYTLSFRPATVKQLAIEYGLSLPAIHKHLKVLERAELIYRRKNGRTNYVALNRKSLAVSQKWLMQFNTQWGNDKATLENFIAGMSKHDRALTGRWRAGNVNNNKQRKGTK